MSDSIEFLQHAVRLPGVEIFDDFPKYCTPLSGGMYIYNGPTDKELMQIRHDCLRMAVQHANVDQVKDGTVYKIADDYYNYITNKTK